MEKFKYLKNLTKDENYSHWRLSNSNERLHNNQRLLSEEEARKLFDKYYPDDERTK
tara:strand:+ start:1082 stop:1249 length:168 start_codon:yes stop_codon:yes gene_type:complete